MIPDLGQLRSTGNAETVAVKNKVLKNTYMLLSASMVPTVAGAWLGIKSGFSLFSGSPLISMLLFLGIAFGFFYAIEKFKNSPVGVYLLLGFTFFMGLMLSRLVGFALGMQNGAQLIGLAAPAVRKYPRRARARITVWPLPQPRGPRALPRVPGEIRRTDPAPALVEGLLAARY